MWTTLIYLTIKTSFLFHLHNCCKWTWLMWNITTLFQITKKVDSNALNEAFLKIKPFFKGFDNQKNAFYSIQVEIDEDMKLCSEEVKLVLFVNDVLDKPIIISSGSKKNHLQITIRNDGTVIRKWITITWVYFFS